MSDLLFHCAHFEVYEPIDETEMRALEYLPSEYLYYIQFNHAMFQSVIWRERMIMIASRKPLQFTPPNIPYKKCLLQVIGKLSDSTLDFELSAEELDCIKELPSGWKLSELNGMTGYHSEPLPQINFEMVRLCWYLGAPNPIEANDCWFIHPSLDRPLTGPEWDAIQAASGDAPLVAWLGGVASQAAVSNAAEGPIPASREGTASIGSVAVVDLRPFGTFPSLAIYPYPEPRKPMRLFNVNSDGTLKRDWALISNRKEGTLTYEPSIINDSGADESDTSAEP